MCIDSCLQSKNYYPGGIFSLHAHHSAGILTASKDGSVALTALLPDVGLAAKPSRQWIALHDGLVVKCARWAADGAPVFASCGNDGAVRVVDTRAGDDGTVLAEEAHGGQAVNCVRWAPGAPEFVLTSGFDPCIRVWDLRTPNMALHTFTGHLGSARYEWFDYFLVFRLPTWHRPGIYQPAFMGDGALVASGGERSGCISLYSMRTGGVVSRGVVEFGDVPTLCAVGGRLLGAAPGFGVVSMCLQQTSGK